jgi:hypothetical protein
MSWSTDTFSHVRQAASLLQSRMDDLHKLLALGPDLADPEKVHVAGREIEDALEVFWAPVTWDSTVCGDDPRDWSV